MLTLIKQLDQYISPTVRFTTVVDVITTQWNGHATLTHIYTNIHICINS